MQPFTILKSKATPLDKVNVDTDQIVPKQFLKLVSRTGFGQYLFYDWRFDKDGNARPEFVLNDPKYKGRMILLARDNFGSGSSREHAAWAILDYGFKAVIAPSFADIFYNNCFKNGILPIRLSQEQVELLFSDDSLELEVDLQAQMVRVNKPGNVDPMAAAKETMILMHFEIDPFRKKLLLEGLDGIDLTLKFEGEIARYENERRLSLPFAR